MNKQKEQTIIMANSNATSNHKLPLIFVGKSENPHCSKGVNKSVLPMKYYAAWVDTEIFTKWFQEESFCVGG